MMLLEKIRLIHDDMKEWRHYLHQHPETAFEENKTSAYIASQLESFGLNVHHGIAGTGVVATLSTGTSEKKIALRADMDALDIEEDSTLAYRSKHPGKMHACGHDGHSAMLLGAAKHLAETRNFDGTVYFIFQPAEEVKAGAKRMIEEGLFEKFPAESVFGMHSWPNIPVGEFRLKEGPMMASMDTFEITVKGVGSHAAMPHHGKDPIIASAHLITVLQTIASRHADPMDAVVVSVTQIQGGDTWNVIPDKVTIRGTFRCFKPALQQQVQERIEQLAVSTCEGLGLSAAVAFNPENPGYPVMSNTKEQTAIAREVLHDLVGAQNVTTPTPSMGAEDFAFMLQERPGCYVWTGNGPGDNGCTLHNPKYDFNDDTLLWGAAYWVSLTETVLAK